MGMRLLLYMATGLLLSLLVTFVSLHGRFPVGSGEVLNWIFGL
jgi:hypothetical protein